jgi:amino acid adenylation domain-containing protein
MNVVTRYYNVVLENPEQIALVVNGKEYTYKDFWHNAGRLSSAISATEQFDRSYYIGVLAYRSVHVYESFLAIARAGKAYLPFNPKFPVERMLTMVDIASCKILIVAPEFYTFLGELLDKLPKDVLLVFPEAHPQIISNNFLSKEDIENCTATFEITKCNEGDPVYLLFTSGTTGEPKGIPISHQNLNIYIEIILTKYPLTPSDRCSQTFDTTFDLSMHDIWITWSAGATLCVLLQSDLLSPGRFINKMKITIWFSVPSLGYYMHKIKALKEAGLSSLRISFFCGEALNYDLVDKWHKAAPNSVIVNLYGPTETTISIADFICLFNTHNEKDQVVPIGRVFPYHDYKVVNNLHEEVGTNNEGELLLSGPQVAAGYLNKQQKTSEQFIKIEEMVWYKTGDLVKEDETGCIYYLGRIDNQVKIRGYRIELQEIEAIIKQITSCVQVVAIAYPVNNYIAEGIVCFIDGSELMDKHKVIELASKQLSDYMIPKEIFYVNGFPLNSNGKIDRNTLISTIK